MTAASPQAACALREAKACVSLTHAVSSASLVRGRGFNAAEGRYTSLNNCSASERLNCAANSAFVIRSV